jgi:hypothetical protein
MAKGRTDQTEIIRKMGSKTSIPIRRNAWRKGMIAVADKAAIRDRRDQG